MSLCKVNEVDQRCVRAKIVPPGGVMEHVSGMFLKFHIVGFVLRGSKLTSIND